MFRVLLFIFGLIMQCETTSDPSLRLVHVMFRHGDRTPSHTFPTDPNKEHAWSQGFGQLTQLGTQQVYALGQMLRRRYGGFLNATYTPHEIRVRSTDKDRVLMSSEALLAGLYLPSGQQMWNPDLKWLPISVHTMPLDNDRVLNIYYDCLRYDQLEERAYSSETVRRYKSENAEELMTMAVKSGMGINTSFSDLLSTVPDPLFIEKIHNLSWADWVTEDLYEKSLEMSELRLQLFGFYPDMVKIKGGRWVYDALANMKNYTLGLMDRRQRVFLYGAHDTTTAVALSIMGVYNSIKPPYGALFALELHQYENKYYVKIFYKNDTVDDYLSEPDQLQFPGCPDPCLLEDFEQLVAHMIFASDEEQIEFCKQSLKPNNVEGTMMAVIVVVISGALVITTFGVLYHRKRNHAPME